MPQTASICTGPKGPVGLSFVGSHSSSPKGNKSDVLRELELTSDPGSNLDTNFLSRKSGGRLSP
jgi:hypothetical protein